MTEFPIESTHDSRIFLQSIERWILGSPHTGLTQQDMAPIITGEETRTEKGKEMIEALVLKEPGKDRAGIRYTRTEGSLQWITTAVFSRENCKSWVGIRVACESSHAETCLPQAKKPVLVKTLLQELGGAKDGCLSISDRCVRLTNTDIELAARLIRGEAGCRLPIIYVSVEFGGAYIVDPNRLARELAGMAHVVVEPNRPFSHRLKIDVGAENVYGGTVGMYLPEGGGRRSYFLGRDLRSADDVAKAVTRDVWTALANRRGMDSCSWASLQEAVSRQRIEELRKSGSRELQDYISTFDQESAAKDERLADADQEIRRLQAECRNYESRLAASSGALLKTGTEEDFYPSEIFGIVRDAIQEASRRVQDGSRRQHVLMDILVANPTQGDAADSMREELRSLLRDSRRMDTKLRRALEKMGFAVSEEGKHCKLVFRGDDRYTFILPKSGSDHRGGLNAASEIIRRLL